jgi:polysaccharide export outer membrane protein
MMNRKTVALTTVMVILGFASAVMASGQNPASGTPVAAGHGPVSAGALPAPTAAPQLQRRNPRYQVSDGDTLDLNFPYTPEFNQTLKVQPDGYISVRGVGDIHVEGETVPEIEEALRAGYAKIMNNPDVTVTLKTFNMPYFVASGQVAKPGKYDLRGQTTLVEALAMAGGVSKDAKPSRIYVFHRVSQQWVEVKKVNVKRMLHAGNLQEDMNIQPGDLIWVPKSGFAKVSRFIPYSSLGLFYGSTF